MNLIGERFGRLRVLRQTEIVKAGWLCVCDCGRAIKMETAALRGGTRSCGCLIRDTTRLRRRSHGMTHSPEWRSWSSMRRRCRKTDNKDYHRYGGRGIAVCDRWADSFANFIADMGPRPKGTTIDRIDNDGNYEPGNCRWATRAEQRANQTERGPDRQPRKRRACA